LGIEFQVLAQHVLQSAYSFHPGSFIQSLKTTFFGRGQS
jgi:hypothetical protein